MAYGSDECIAEQKTGEGFPRGRRLRLQLRRIDDAGCVHVCMYVCERVREGEREEENIAPLRWSVAGMSTQPARH